MHQSHHSKATIISSTDEEEITLYCVVEMGERLIAGHLKSKWEATSVLKFQLTYHEWFFWERVFLGSDDVLSEGVAINSPDARHLKSLLAADDSFRSYILGFQALYQNTLHNFQLLSERWLSNTSGSALSKLEQTSTSSPTFPHFPWQF